MRLPRFLQRGENPSADHFNEMLRFMRSLIPHGDKKTIRVSQNSGGTTYSVIYRSAGVQGEVSEDYYKGYFKVTLDEDGNLKVSKSEAVVNSEWWSIPEDSLTLQSGYIYFECGYTETTDALDVVSGSLSAPVYVQSEDLPEFNENYFRTILAEIKIDEETETIEIIQHQHGMIIGINWAGMSESGLLDDAINDALEEERKKYDDKLAVYHCKMYSSACDEGVTCSPSGAKNVSESSATAAQTALNSANGGSCNDNNPPCGTSKYIARNVNSTDGIKYTGKYYDCCCGGEPEDEDFGELADCSDNNSACKESKACDGGKVYVGSGHKDYDTAKTARDELITYQQIDKLCEDESELNSDQSYSKPCGYQIGEPYPISDGNWGFHIGACCCLVDCENDLNDGSVLLDNGTLLMQKGQSDVLVYTWNNPYPCERFLNMHVYNNGYAIGVYPLIDGNSPSTQAGKFRVPEGKTIEFYATNNVISLDEKDVGWDISL